MNIEVAHLVPKKNLIVTDNYDNDLPVDCITDLSVQLRGEGEWSAYCCFSNRVTMQVAYENGVSSIDFSQDYDKVIKSFDDSSVRISTCVDIYFEDDESVVIDGNGTGWTVENLFDGLKVVAEGEGRR
jgi:hypothetical protein